MPTFFISGAVCPLSLFFCFGKSFTVGVAVKKSHGTKKRGVERGRSSIEGAIYAMDSKSKLSLSHYFSESLPRRATASSMIVDHYESFFGILKKICWTR